MYRELRRVFIEGLCAVYIETGKSRQFGETDEELTEKLFSVAQLCIDVER